MFSIKPRVKESTITTGSGPYALSGAMVGYQSFAEIGDGNITEYFCTDNISWEAGLGTLSLAPSQLARTEVMASSNGGSAVNWGAGTKEIFISPLPEMLAHSGLWPLTAAGRFEFESASSCRLNRYQGKHIPIHSNGVPVYREIPAAGVALSNSGLLPNTNYYTYAYWSGSAIGLEASTTGHSADANSGLDIKTGDSTRTPVGWLRTGGSSEFIASSMQALDDKAILAPYSPLAAFENLLVVLPLFTTVVVNATKFVVTNSNGRKQVVPVTSVTINITASGVNGLDTGVEAANSWYYYYVIWNGATVAGLFSLSATSPVMPAGYTHKGLAGAARNDGNSNFGIFEQRGTYVDLKEVPVLSFGSATAVTPFSLAAAVPPNVFKALLETHYVPLAGGVNVLASIWSESTGVIAVTRTGNVSTMDTAHAMRASSLALLRVSQTLFYTVQTNSYLDVAVIGYIW